MRSSFAGPLVWSSSSLMFSALAAMSWPTKSSSCYSPSSTLPWIPSSTPTVTRRWAQPSGRSCAARGRRMWMGRQQRDPTDLHLPSITRCWLAAPCTTITTTMNIRWYKKKKKEKKAQCLGYESILKGLFSTGDTDWEKVNECMWRRIWQLEWKLKRLKLSEDRAEENSDRLLLFCLLISICVKCVVTGKDDMNYLKSVK